MLLCDLIVLNMLLEVLQRSDLVTFMGTLYLLASNGSGTGSTFNFLRT